MVISDLLSVTCLVVELLSISWFVGELCFHQSDPHLLHAGLHLRCNKWEKRELIAASAGLSFSGIYGIRITTNEKRK